MKKLFLLLIFSHAFQLFAQEESFPCTKANSSLKELFSTGKLDNLYVHGCSGPGLHALSSSFLKASGTPPAIIEGTEDDPADDTEYVNWTCKYSAGNLRDGNTATAWVEGVKGYGIGEVLIVPCLNLQKKVEIWTGYGKSENLFKYNSRPKKVKVIIVRAKPAGFTQYGTDYENLTQIKSVEVSLLDKNGYQPIAIPSFTVEKYDDENEYAYFLGIEILEVYKGSKWDDTCISEIRNVEN